MHTLPRISAFLLVMTVAGSTTLFGCKKILSDAVADAAGTAISQGLEAGLADAGLADDGLSSIKFKRRDPQIGSSFTNVSTTDMNLEMTTPKKSSFTEKENRTSKIDILAADGKTILKVKVAFQAYSKVDQEGTKTKDLSAPVVGKTYIAEWKDKKILVTDENHKKVSAKEEKATKSEVNDMLGKPDPLLTALPAAPMKVGDKADTLSEALRDLLAANEGDKVELTESHVTLSKIEMQGGQKVGVFDMQTKVTFKQAFNMTMDLTGTITVREADGKVTGVTLKGPLTMAGGGINASGNVNATQTRTY